MKKIIVFVITAALFAGLLPGCGQTAKAPATGQSSEQKTTTDTNNPGTAAQGGTGGNTADSTGGNTSASTGSSSKEIYKEPGSELGDFADSFTNPEESFSKIIDSSIEDNMDTLSAKMSIGVANMPLATLGLYDALSLGDEPKKEGKLVLSGFDAVREKSGSEIKFSASHEYDKNLNQYKKGDKCSEQGVLDMAANTLKYEEKTERAGKVIARTVLEAVILKDGTHLLQYLSFAQNYREGDPPTKAVIFKRFNKDEYTALAGSFNENADFPYNSIIGKGDIKPETMAQNYQITGKISITGGKASFTK